MPLSAPRGHVGYPAGHAGQVTGPVLPVAALAWKMRRGGRSGTNQDGGTASTRPSARPRRAGPSVGHQSDPPGTVEGGERDGDAAIFSWGNNAHALLGRGQTPERLPAAPLPQRMPLPPGVCVASVAVGRAHAVAATTRGLVLAWGRGAAAGAIASAATDSAAAPGAAPPPGRAAAGAPGAGGEESGVGGDDGRLVLSPHVVEGVPRVAAVAAGGDVSVVLTAAGEVWTWGDGHGCGHLGLGAAVDVAASPARVALPRVPQVGPSMDADGDPFTPLHARRAAAAAARAAATSASAFASAARARARALGLTPEAAAALAEASTVPSSSTHGSAMAGFLAAAAAELKASGAVDDDGGGDDGGDGGDTEHMVPAGRVACVAAGGRHAGCVTASGWVLLWGDGADGRLGLFSEAARHAPAVVTSLSAVFGWRLALGARHSALLSRTGRLYTWGDGAGGALGHNDARGQPAQRLVEAFGKAGGAAAARVWAGDGCTGVVCGDGATYLWGRGGDGRLGTGDNNMCVAPMRVPALSGTVGATGGGEEGAAPLVASLACGASHTLAALNGGGGVLACGDARSGALGWEEAKRRGSALAPALIPYFEAHGTRVTAVAAGDGVSFAVQGRPWEETCPALCAAVGDARVAVAWDGIGRLRVRCFQRDGSPRTYGGDSVSVCPLSLSTVEPHATAAGDDKDELRRAAEACVRDVRVFDADDGTYCVRFTASWAHARALLRGGSRRRSSGSGGVRAARAAREGKGSTSHGARVDDDVRPTAAVLELDVRVDGVGVGGSPFRVAVVPGLPVPQLCAMEGEGLRPLSVGAHEVRVRAVGVDCGRCCLAGLPFRATLRRAMDGAAAVAHAVGEPLPSPAEQAGEVAVEVHDVGGGEYSVRYTVTEAKPHMLDVRLFGRRVRQSPVPIEPSPAALSGRTEVIYDWPVERADAGVAGVWDADKLFLLSDAAAGGGSDAAAWQRAGYHRLTVPGRDAFGNAVRVGGDDVAARIDAPDGGPIIYAGCWSPPQATAAGTDATLEGGARVPEKSATQQRRAGRGARRLQGAVGLLRKKGLRAGVGAAVAAGGGVAGGGAPAGGGAAAGRVLRASASTPALMRGETAPAPRRRTSSGSDGNGNSNGGHAPGSLEAKPASAGAAAAQQRVGTMPRLCAALVKDNSDGTYTLYLKALCAGEYRVTLLVRPKEAALAGREAQPSLSGPLRLTIQPGPPVVAACCVRPLSTWSTAQRRVLVHVVEPQRGLAGDSIGGRATAVSAAASSLSSSRSLAGSRSSPALHKLRRAARAVAAAQTLKGAAAKRAPSKTAKTAKAATATTATKAAKTSAQRSGGGRGSSGSGELFHRSRTFGPNDVEAELVRLSYLYGQDERACEAAEDGRAEGDTAAAGPVKPRHCVLELEARDFAGNAAPFEAATLQSAGGDGRCAACKRVLLFEEAAGRKSRLDMKARTSSASSMSAEAPARDDDADDLEVSVVEGDAVDVEPQADSSEQAPAVDAGDGGAALAGGEHRGEAHTCGMVVWARNQMGALVAADDLRLEAVGGDDGSGASMVRLRLPWGDSVKVGPKLWVTWRGSAVPGSPFAVPMPREFVERIGGGYSVPGLARGGPGAASTGSLPPTGR